jgi:hypothetical protein
MEVTVKESFDVKDRVARDYGATGVVVVYELPADAAELARGASVLLVRADGWVRACRIGEVREHGGSGRSFFLEGLGKQDVPVGTRLRWGGRLLPEDISGAIAQTA